jgi:signal transduction histidine kinase
MMVESLLTLARADEPGFVHPHTLRLADFANDIAIRFAGLSANITLMSPRPLEVDIDGERVAQALLNVVSNSIRHNSDEVNVRVDWLVDGQLLAIQVDDDGRGFPDRPDCDLLAPFVSGEAGGSGLGLSVAQIIAAAHGGRVILGPSPTGGARVVIEIPVVRP